MSTLKEMITIMQHFEDGGTGVQAAKYESPILWEEVCEPLWDWDNYDYRIKHPVNWKIVKHFEEGGKVHFKNKDIDNWLVLDAEADFYFNFTVNEYRIVKED